MTKCSLLSIYEQNNEQICNVFITGNNFYSKEKLIEKALDDIEYLVYNFID